MPRINSAAMASRMHHASAGSVGAGHDKRSWAGSLLRVATPAYSLAERGVGGVGVVRRILSADWLKKVRSAKDRPKARWRGET